MATRAPPLLLSLCLCFVSCFSSRWSDELAASGNGYYRTTAFLVDGEGRRLRAELAACGGGPTAYGDDVPRVDVYARYL
uniref:Uncharacterized protein n=1 Tax=Oryza brachyantha TaxID=4533 RepID=J3MGT5_ORYBR